MNPSTPDDTHKARPWPWFAAAVALGYALVAIAVHHAGPFYVYDMYAFKSMTSTSRLSLVDDAGAVRDVRSVRAIRCPEDTVAQLGAGACDGISTIDARDDEVWDVLQTRGKSVNAPSTTQLRLVRRTFQWGDGEVRVSDCASVVCDVVVGGDQP
jgi:hypothetical protein